MIWYTTPYSTELNIGDYYNNFSSMVPNDDYICFMDGDVIFTTPDYGHIIESVVRENPSVDCFTCYTNRVNCKWQVCPECDTTIDDYTYHQKLGASLRDKYGTSVVDCTNKQLFSGMLFVIKNSSFRKFGGVMKDGMLGVDNQIHNCIKYHNMKLYLMKGLYVYHWHRGSCFNQKTEHLTKKTKPFNSATLKPNKEAIIQNKSMAGLSVIVCCNNKVDATHLTDSIKATNMREVEFIICNNKLNEKIGHVYNKMAEKAKYENLLLVHQDVVFKDTDFSQILEKLSEPSCGCIGFAGSKVRVKAITTWNQLREYNVTNYYDGDFSKRNAQNASVTGFSNVVCLDGFALFTKKSVLSAYPFDVENTTFHGYDIDYTLTLKMNGLSNYVYTGDAVKVMHRSKGTYDKEWFKTIIYLTYYKWGDIIPIRTSDVPLSDFNAKIKTGMSSINTLYNNRLNKLSYTDKKDVIKYYNDAMSGKNRKTLDTMKGVIYTCITGGYDTLTDPKTISKGFDYVCFTDDPTLTSGVWKMRPIPDDLKDLSNVKKQRMIKVLPHKYLKDYDLSVWVDGSIDILGDVSSLIANIANTPSWNHSDIFIPVHPRRKCIYDEASACIRMNKDKRENIEPQMERYRKDGFPEKYGLPQSNIVIRKHNEKNCMKVMDIWAEEITNGSHRDQLSFNYALWKSGCENVHYLNKDLCRSVYFKWNSTHPKPNRKKSGESSPHKIKNTTKTIGNYITI